ncbi:Ulp1 peptidase [Malassezia yamatoensis]|uniref:Ulp1 peptidase n=1 Tax=Malassezia yamatoensis TaxID=253288 RepID=A0AAJ5YTX4_9BASI|nr:Ulp1 peptidase [Malassezia yamatoensis]
MKGSPRSKMSRTDDTDTQIKSSQETKSSDTEADTLLTGSSRPLSDPSPSLVESGGTLNIERKSQGSHASRIRPPIPITPQVRAASKAQLVNSSPDELDMLAPLKPAPLRMRRKDHKTASVPSMPAISLALRAVYIGEWYAENLGLELVCFPRHLSLMLDTTECIKIAMRDVVDWMIGGELHHLFILVLKQTSTRIFSRLIPERNQAEGSPRICFFVKNDTAAQLAQWDALLKRVRGKDVRPAQLLTEAGTSSLLLSLQQTAMYPINSLTAKDSTLMNPNNLISARSQSEESKPIQNPSNLQNTDAPGITEIASPVAESSDASTDNEHDRPRRSSRNNTENQELNQPIFRYPDSGPFAVTILRSDLRRLDPEEFLNDTIIEFGMKYICEQIRERDPHLVNQMHLFNTFFFEKMSEFRDRSKSYGQVRKWTKGVDIFSKKYVVIPINQHLHWYLAIIVNPAAILQERDQVDIIRRSPRNSFDFRSDVDDAIGASPSKEIAQRANGPTRIIAGENRKESPTEAKSAYVLLLDSLGGTHGAVKTVLRDYLRFEAKDKHRVPPETDLKKLGDLIGVDVHVASQPNFCDCGLYLLHNFQCFFSDPQIYLHAALSQRRSALHPDNVWRAGDMSQYRKNWQDLLNRLSASWRNASDTH